MDISEFLQIPVYDPQEGDCETPHAARMAQLSYVLQKTNKQHFHLEFGVYKGTSINHCASLYPDVTFYGFDSFFGIPAPMTLNDSVKLPTGSFNMNGELPFVEKNVKLIPGLFNETLKDWVRHHSGPIGFINMDCDLYTSTKCVLELLNDQIVPGTYIIFDELCDWRHITKQPDGRIPFEPYTKWYWGEWAALEQWVVKKNRKIRPICRTWAHGAAIEVIS